jgi:hypothetical protein
MAWLRRAAILGCAVAVVTAALTFGDPNPPEAKANIACGIGVSPAAPITGALGIGNPVGDICNAVTDPILGVAGHVLDPLKKAAASLRKGVFDQITTWASDGAVWLLGEVVELTQKTTSPNLLSKGFLRQYRQMASIAVVLAALMLIFAALEGLGRGEGSMLLRVFLVNVPVAAIATSAAYVVVQLLVATTDGFSEVIAHSTAADSREFFKSAVEALGEAGAAGGAAAGTVASGPGAGTATGAGSGAVAVPLFVGFIAAIVAAFAAFLVWIELLMRDAAIYAVALFMPLAIAASIWPRWMSALRRTGELVIVVVFSKFVIVSIIALAASLLANTGMFDGATSDGLDLDAPLVVLDLSAVQDSATLGILMTCAAAWLQGVVMERKRAAEAGERDGAKVIVAVDEAWRITADLGVAEWLQRSFKLSRAHGVQNIIALHRLSDLGAAGAQGSREARIAEGLIADADTKVILAQPPDQIEGLRNLLGLSATEAELVPTLRRGEALWMVGRRSFLVQHRLSSFEQELVDTTLGWFATAS